MALPRSMLLIISGSIAAYKSLELIRLLRARGVEMTAILTKGGAEFITPLAVSALTGTKTYTDLFSLTNETEMGHIELSRAAELVLVAPASANLLARMAAGLADDLATTALLATNKPVIVAPAMNHKMWSHPATTRNLAQLNADGITVIDPTEGDMACNERGVGRMAEPAAIVAFLEEYNKTRHPREGGDLLQHPRGAEKEIPAFAGMTEQLRGRHAIVTSGPTAEAIDPVRFLGNRSSGKQGHAIAAALAARGARVTLISGPVSLPDPLGVTTVHVRDAEAMLAAVTAALPADIFIAAAAVADWKLAQPMAEKLKKTAARNSLSLELIPTVDVLATVAQSAARPALVIGFAAETEQLLDHARTKRRAKGCDWLLANSVAAGATFGDNENTVTLITEQAETNWPRMEKTAVAAKLVETIIQHLSQPKLVKGKRA